MKQSLNPTDFSLQEIEEVLFVCTGNTCRSPMAESLFNFLVKEKIEKQHFQKRVKATSAGIRARSGEDANPYSAAALNHLFQLDLNSHTAVKLTAQQMEKTDLILTMTSDQERSLKIEYPLWTTKIFSLSSFLKTYGISQKIDEKGFNDFEVGDPYGQNQDFYNFTAQLLERILSLIVDCLVEK